MKHQKIYVLATAAAFANDFHGSGQGLVFARGRRLTQFFYALLDFLLESTAHASIRRLFEAVHTSSQRASSREFKYYCSLPTDAYFAETTRWTLARRSGRTLRTRSHWKMKPVWRWAWAEENPASVFFTAPSSMTLQAGMRESCSSPPEAPISFAAIFVPFSGS